MIKYLSRGLAAVFLLLGFVLATFQPGSPLVTDNVEARDGDPCNIDYTPCSCRNYSAMNNDLQIYCNVTSPQDYVAIQSAFGRSPAADHGRLQINVQAANVTTPPDVLKGKRVREINFYCSNKTMILGPIATDAFSSSADLTVDVLIRKCDLNNFKFYFLQSLTKLETISLYYSALQTFDSMPYLPSLRHVLVSYCPGFRQWYTPSQTPSLAEITIENNEDIDDARMDGILASFGNYYSTFKTLSAFYLTGNNLTRVPRALSSTFSGLDTVSLAGNRITVLTKGSVDFTASPAKNLYISGTQMDLVEEGAFLGDFSATNISLENNKLTTFSSTVYKSLLEGMMTSTTNTSINVKRNWIKYDCGLAWLLRDNRRLLARVQGQVANGTDFDDLDPNELAHC